MGVFLWVGTCGGSSTVVRYLSSLVENIKKKLLVRSKLIYSNAVSISSLK